MLKKAGIATAVATAALLALSPFAFAADEDDSNGIDKGNLIGEGNAADHCNENFAGGGTIFKDSAGADCTTSGEAYGQKREQFDRNED